ncbi:hypothetical protein BR93DRAFT_332387 [Coniochaeta sp. PMI_546]|nr:hypothetical protein BR93DRAFT_332387 [Coniochaeta sp. PMI_546]
MPRVASLLHSAPSAMIAVVMIRPRQSARPCLLHTVISEQPLLALWKPSRAGTNMVKDADHSGLVYMRSSALLLVLLASSSARSAEAWQTISSV